MKLFDHQRKALEATKGLHLVAYYIDMGGGKTFIGSEKATSFNEGVILIICQKSKIQDWMEHFAKYYKQFLVLDLTRKNCLEDFMERSFESLDGWLANPVVGVINYDLVFRRKELLNLQKFTLMLDESSIIQNEKAKRSKFILKMHPRNVILLSGTPTSGKYENLWTQIHLLGWNINIDLYQRQYVNWTTIEVGGVPIKVVDKENPYKNIDRLKLKLRSHGAVFMKTEEFGIDLPDQNFLQVKVEQSKEYGKFIKNKFVVVDDTELMGDTSLTALLYARQLCGQYSKEKLNAVKDLIESTQDRLIIFYNFDKELELLKILAEDYERPISEVNGHNKDLTAYENESNSITLVQYQSGSMGLNLQKANKIIYFTLPLMSELFEQSKKRIHRIGQKNTCFYYILLVKGSVEYRILHSLEERKDYTDELFKDV